MMPGSKTNAMSRKEVLEAVRSLPPAQDFVWNGEDEDDRPATGEELRAGVEARLEEFEANPEVW
jgi:hypothetical protein